MVIFIYSTHLWIINLAIILMRIDNWMVVLELLLIIELKPPKFRFFGARFLTMTNLPCSAINLLHQFVAWTVFTINFYISPPQSIRLGKRAMSERSTLWMHYMYIKIYMYTLYILHYNTSVYTSHQTSQQNTWNSNNKTTDHSMGVSL